jgi:hypothetical protein
VIIEAADRGARAEPWSAACAADANRIFNPQGE